MLRNILIKKNIEIVEKIYIKDPIIISKLFGKNNNSYSINYYSRFHFSEFNSQNASKGKINQMKNRNNNFNNNDYTNEKNQNKFYSSKSLLD